MYLSPGVEAPCIGWPGSLYFSGCVSVAAGGDIGRGALYTGRDVSIGYAAAVQAGGIGYVAVVAGGIGRGVLPGVFPNQLSCRRNKEWLILG